MGGCGRGDRTIWDHIEDLQTTLDQSFSVARKVHLCLPRQDSCGLEELAGTCVALWLMNVFYLHGAMFHLPPLRAIHMNTSSRETASRFFVGSTSVGSGAWVIL